MHCLRSLSQLARRGAPSSTRQARAFLQFDFCRRQASAASGRLRPLVAYRTIFARLSADLDHRKIIPTYDSKLNCPTPDMPKSKKQRSLLQPSAAAHSKALLLPMPRKEATDLVLHARIALARLRNGEADRSLLNLVLQVTLIAGFITQAGYGKLDIEVIETVQHGLEDILLVADNTGRWNVPETLPVHLVKSQRCHFTGSHAI